jgi:hypothetical protein
MELKDIPILGGALGFFGDEDIDYGVAAAIVGILIIFVLLTFLGVSQSKMVTFVFMLSPIWLPYMAFHIFFDKWMEMVGKKFRINSGRTIFEIKLPAEVFKSPEAMEFVFTQVYNAASPDNLMETYLDGKRPLPYTFELASRGGDVHLYATIPNKFVSGFTDNMYAQYPGIEIVQQLVDYTSEIPHDLKGWSFMSFHFAKKKNQVYPIKTYIEYGMDKLPKEEEKVDPMTPMLEMLAGIKPNQQMWIQFLCIAHRPKSFKNGQLKAEDTWEHTVHEEIDKIMGRDEEKKGGVELEGMVRLTTGERDTIDVMDRNAGKAPFEFACRVCYISNKEWDYDGGLYSRMIRSLAQTEIRGRNGIGMRWRTDFNYRTISDPFRKIIPALKRQELKEYKLRVLFPKTSGMGYKIMTAEELATIFHVPGSVAQTPTLNRVPSTRGEAPSNLPTGNLPI